MEEREREMKTDSSIYVHVCSLFSLGLLYMMGWTCGKKTIETLNRDNT